MAKPAAAVVAESPRPDLPPPTRSQLRRQRRLERYQQVAALFQSGLSQAAIGRETKLGSKTIRRWLRQGQFPERKSPHRRPPKVNEFADYLQQRWDEGCHNASRLYQEIRQKGYSGKRAMVARMVSGWRKTGKAARPKAPADRSPARGDPRYSCRRPDVG
jgi:transposase